MERGVACWVAVSLVVATVFSPAALAATPDDAYGMPQEFDPDSVSLSATLQENGDAEWTFTYRTRLTNDNETAAFESLQDDIRTNTSEYVGQFEDRITATVAAAENSTGREMSVTNVSVSTRVNSLNQDSLGVVTYSFEWHGFAAVEENAITAGDALEGFYLDNETSLTVAWPDGYEAVEVDPEATEPRENAVQWRGPLEFGAGQPSVVAVPSGDGTTTTATTADQTTTDGGQTDESDGGGLLVPTLGGAIVVLLLGGAGWLFWRREMDGGDGSAPAASPGPDSGGAGATAGETGSDQPPSELLSNEERVKRFLASQGGRAKQQAVVEELGWTEAKTSQVVKQMREDDELESFRIGRENVLKLPDADAPGEGYGE